MPDKSPSEEIPEISNLENAILHAVWHGHKTAREICDVLPDYYDGKKLAFSTVSTYLMRMVQKNFLERKPIGAREFEFSALVDELDAATQLNNKSKNDVKIQTHMLKHFAGNKNYPQEVQKLLSDIYAQIRGIIGQ